MGLTVAVGQGQEVAVTSRVRGFIAALNQFKMINLTST